MIALNQSVFLFIHHFAGHFVWLDDIGIFFAEYLAYFMVAAFLILAYYQRGWRQKLYVFCEGALAVILARGVITEVVRFFYHSPRPFSFFNFMPLIPEIGWSFPSGHMAWFFALSLTVWYFNRRWGWWFFVLSLVMGVARIYVGVHWPLDIIAGIVVGLFSGWFVHWVLRKQRRAIFPSG